MKADNYFNFKRIYYLIYRYLRLNFITLLIVTGSIAGYLILSNLITLINIHNSGNFHDSGIQWNLFRSSITLIYIGGFILTSGSFNEIHSSSKGCFYMTLPVSTLEKLTATWLITAIGYYIYSIIVLLVINVVLIAIGNIFTVVDFKLFNPFSNIVLEFFGKYLVIQSVFLFGAVYFRKANFFKTILSLFLIFTFISIYTLILSRIFIFPQYNLIGSGAHFGFNDLSVIQDFPELKVIFNILFWYIMLPFFLFISYIRLKERQV